MEKDVKSWGQQQDTRLEQIFVTSVQNSIHRSRDITSLTSHNIQSHKQNLTELYLEILVVHEWYHNTWSIDHVQFRVCVCVCVYVCVCVCVCVCVYQIFFLNSTMNLK
jgi:hypothetical protein